MLGAVHWGLDAMTILPTGSVVLCEDDATQHKKKELGRCLGWLIGKIFVYHGIVYPHTQVVDSLGSGGQEMLPIFWADLTVLPCRQHVSPGSALPLPPYQPQRSYFWRMPRHGPKFSLLQKVFRPCQHEPQRSKCLFKPTWVFIRHSLCCLSDLKRALLPAPHQRLQFMKQKMPDTQALAEFF